MSTPFTRNNRDHSNDTGYQFEFFCDKCGNGHRSSFQTSGLGVASKMLKAAGSLFGGRLWSAGHGADHLKDALRGPAWDKAFEEAITEMRPKFRQCTRCGKWVCPEVCWNEVRALCEDCAPDLQEEAAAAQASAAAEQVRTKAREVDHVGHVDMKQAQVAACPHCNARLAPGARFCAGCGKPVGAAAQAKTFCSQCGAEVPPGGRFCPGCGKTT
jgi:double zinc ribbon protein